MEDLVTILLPAFSDATGTMHGVLTAEMPARLRLVGVSNGDGTARHTYISAEAIEAATLQGTVLSYPISGSRPGFIRTGSLKPLAPSFTAFLTRRTEPMRATSCDSVAMAFIAKPNVFSGLHFGSFYRKLSGSETKK
jgi:hypothetical protein